MARGIEELAEMQVTGPVQGGDMVMKPDQAPVGAAALLSKMAKKNTPGIFKLPMPDKQMPDFMKVARMGIDPGDDEELPIDERFPEFELDPLHFPNIYDVDEEQIAKGDTTSTMAGELLRQGFDPIMIKGMDPLSIQILYERTFGSERDADELSSAVQDLRNKVKTVETFAPEDHQLAYITPKEGEMLKLLGGSGETNPITGIKQYPEVTQTQAEEQYGVSPSQWAQGFGAGETVTGGGVQDQPSIAAAIANIDAQESYQDTQNIYDQLAAGHSSEAINEARRAGVELPETPEKGNMLNKALDYLGVSTGILPMMKFTEGLDKVAQAWEKEQVQDLISKIGTGEAATGWGNLLAAMTTDGKLNKRGEKWLDEWGDELGEGSLDAAEKDWSDDPDKMLKELIATASASGGDEFMKHYDPDTYYKDPKNWDAKEMAQAQREGKLTMNPKNTAMIEEGRRRLEQEAGPAQDRHPGTRRPIEEQITEEEVATTTTDPRAGAFNVGGTMPYTHDVATGGVEMDVPLGRRFQIDKDKKYRGTTGGMDLNEAMQYATLGGYGQLEPFQEYLTRRRKHLGEEEPQYFDEEGNVIYSEVT